MTPALDLAAATFARSLTARVCTALAVLATPVFATGMVLLARSGLVTGPSAVKFEPLAEGPAGTAVAALAGQIITVVMVLATGFAVAWLFGREWADGTLGSLFALPVPRATIARAKVAVLAGWVVTVATAAVALTALGVLAVGGPVTPDVGSALLVDWVGALLMGALGLPFGWVAVRFRGYLGAVGGIIAVTAVSQIVAGLGLGRWVPYVAPALWVGAGGADAADSVGPLHLAWALAFAALGTALAVRAFARARLD
jgi:ABC-2 type transport system permease protein